MTSIWGELKRRNVVRVTVAYVIVGWLILQLTDVLVPLLTLPEWVGRLVFLLLLVGFPLALFFAWAYELTPEGLKKEKDVDRSESITHITGRKLDYLIIAVLVLALGFFAFDKFVLQPSRDTELVQATTEAVTEQVAAEPDASAQFDKSIAVLSFVDMSENQDQGWFADGLAAEIINTLVRAPDLMVSSRTSSFAYKGTQTPISQIAKELGVAHILEGSVRRAGDRIRVTAQLIRASDAFSLWSEHFDRSAEEVISIQEDLAINIAKALKTTMDPEALEKMLQAGTRSVEAYEHYLNGLASLIRVLETSNFSLTIDALDHFEMAREADPGFAAAHAQSARIWRTQFVPNTREYGAINVTLQQAFGNFRERLIAAIENAPDETQRMFYEAELAVNELRGAEVVRLLRRVLEKLPNSYDVTLALVRAAIYSRDTEAEILAVENFLRLGDTTAIGMYIYFGRRLVPSEQYVASVLEQVKRFPNSRNIIYQAHRGLLWAGEFEEAHKLYPRLAGETGMSRWIVDARQACSLGERGEAEQILGTAQQEGGNEIHQWHILDLLGEHEEAARLLKPYESEEVPIMLGTYLVYQQFNPRPFPALMSILEREGLDWPPPREIPFACPPKDEE